MRWDVFSLQKDWTAARDCSYTRQHLLYICSCTDHAVSHHACWCGGREGHDWRWLKRHKQASEHHNSPTSSLKVSKIRQEAETTSTTVRSVCVCVSPLRQGSRSWTAPLWAASWCRRSSSSPPAGSSGCHCRLRHLMLAPACNCPESTKLPLFFLHSRVGCVQAAQLSAVTYFFIVPFPMPRSEKEKSSLGKCKICVHKYFVSLCLNEHEL